MIHAADYPIPELDSIFQFHKGSIDTCDTDIKIRVGSDFNSIKVRLIPAGLDRTP